MLTVTKHECYHLAEMAYSKGKDNLPEHFGVLRDLITDSNAYIRDCRGITNWIDTLIARLRVVSNDVGEATFKTQSWHKNIHVGLRSTIPFLSKVSWATSNNLLHKH